MIKKLKMRFVLVNMMILSLVLFSTLSAIYIMMTNSEIKVSNEIMDTLIENHKKSIPFDKSPSPYSDENNFLSGQSGYKNINLVPLSQIGGNASQDKDKKHEDDNIEQKDPFTVSPESKDQWDIQDPWSFPNPWGDQDPWSFPNPWGDQNPWGIPNPWSDQNPWGDQNPWTNFPEITQKTPEQTDCSSNENTDTSITSEPPVTAVSDKFPETQTESISENIIQATPSEIQVTVPKDTEPTEDTTEKTEDTVPEVSSAPPSSESKRPREPAATTKYDGNLVRSHVFAEIGKKNEILDISYQYFFQYDDAEYHLKIRDAINDIISSGSSSGKCMIENISYRYKISDPLRNGNKFLILLDRSIEISTLHRLMITFIIIGCAGLIVVFFVSLLLANWAIKPIEIAWNRQKQFIADASHELKTPLTVIAANTDVVLSTPNELIRDQERWLRYIKSETARMSKLVNELLYIAKSDANEIKMDMSEFDISNTVSGICLIFEPLAFEARRALVSDISPKMRFFGDEDRIKQLVTILIDNAIKYSLPSSQISVSLSRNNQGRIRFCISNNCEELTKENVSKLFDRFYRVDSSRNSSTGGNGLGLNIAQTITEAHNGTISVNYNYGMISFTVIL